MKGRAAPATGQIAHFNDRATINVWRRLTAGAQCLRDGLFDGLVQILFQVQTGATGAAIADCAAQPALRVVHAEQGRHEAADTGSVHVDETTGDEGLDLVAPGVTDALLLELVANSGRGGRRGDIRSKHVGHGGGSSAGRFAGLCGLDGRWDRNQSLRLARARDAVHRQTGDCFSGMGPSNLMPHMTANDKQLVERLLAGDERAFRGFFDEYFDRLYRFALSRTRGDPHLAEEAAQRALCRAVRRLDSYRGEASLFTWLVQICRNELADLFEAAGRDASRNVSMDSNERIRAEAEQVSGAASADPAQQRQADDAGLVVRQVLDELPGRYAEVLEWKYLDELGTQAIADRLGTTFEAAQSTLQRARGAFRSALVSRGLDAASLGL